ncbi:MAG: M48 family metalloprotease, partial [Planctomycetes bacterium]|nr:M48 family metalloprotease [Planctomycetota bacterium]
ATSLSWQGLLLLFWSGTVLSLLLLLIQRALLVKSLVAQAVPCDESLRALLNDCRQRLGLSTQVSLRITSISGSPAVCGLRRPVILMPRDLLTELKFRDLEAVLLHELAHVIRGDLWVNFAQTLLQILYFYHPCLWLANWQIRRIRESAVDEAVLVALKEKATTYPETLVGIARMALSRPALSLRLIGLVENKSELNRRVRRMLARPFPKTARLGLVGFTVLALTGLLLPMAAARQGQPKATDAQAKEGLYCVTGKIMDDTGSPMAGVEVRASFGTGTLMPAGQTTTDEEGKYRLEFGPGMQGSNEQTNTGSLGFRRAAIHASKLGYYEKTLCQDGNLAMAGSEADVPQDSRKNFAGVVLPNQPRTLNFVMTPSASVQGMVINLEGKPVANQQFWITGDTLYPSSTVLTRVSTDEQGLFSVQDVPLKVFRLARTEPHDGVAGIPFYVSQPGPWYMKLRFDDDPERSLPTRILALGRDPKILEKADNRSWTDVPVDPLPQADQVRLRQMLIRMRKANQAWLVCPPETIQAYSYVFTQGDREPVRVNINDPTRA